MYEQPQYTDYLPKFEPPKPAEYYNTDCGNKKSLARCVQDSSKRYAIVSSSTSRFPDRQIGCGNFADYDIDHMNKTSVARGVKESKMKYAATFSSSERWSKTTHSEAPDKSYNTDALRMRTLATIVNESPLRYSNIRSKYSRFGPTTTSCAPDIVYNTDLLNKQSLGESVRTSTRRYAVMKSKQDRLKEENKGKDTGDNLGPGAYDTPCHLDLKRDWRSGPLSSFSSRVERFSAKRDPTKNLGSTYTQEWDKRSWAGHGCKISKSKISRPSYLPDAYEKS
mmetsp:Transcript_34633/g.58193  ORF Transcript_34633/g.58193 Transcript_34633/m.58193 type:complete len:280 (+) Transcript_34633:221-1060(+)|eukprot:CAMPEP_0198210224 /NCGR_PEP_ID=MMETSP1445-20131203/19970_1 /TAXON_ID=36898 /ORGANISM="Pyramimonas sp., Strain CCMP2087" /LENGTH=279 /DNA_ID=CAMNT_0043884231 /DNA_START=206 /DNA_END=1045 /DNA_ORIENTATION=+